MHARLPDLAITNSDRRPFLHQQSCYMEVAAVQCVMQGCDTITVSTPGVIYICSTVQQ